MSKSSIKQVRCLIIEFVELPKNIRKIIHNNHEHANNGCYVEHHSEFDPKDYAKGMDVIKEYYEDQCNAEDIPKDERFKGTIEEFIKAYGLEFDVWLTEQKENIKWENIKKILIHFDW